MVAELFVRTQIEERLASSRVLYKKCYLLCVNYRKLGDLLWRLQLFYC
jgi:hypothetical protein